MYNDIADRGTTASTSSNLVIVPHASLAVFENYFSYRGHVTWNALPEHIRINNNFNSFTIALRSHVMI